MTADAGRSPDPKGWEALRRAEFATDRLNLNPGTLGTPARRVQAACAAFHAATRGWPLGAYGLGRTAAARARAAAPTVGVPGPVTLQAGTTVTTTLLAHALRAHVGRPLRVLTTAHEHPGGLASFARGAWVSHVPDVALDDPEAFADEVHRHQPDLVLLSQILWTNGRALPTGALCRAARSVAPSAWRVVDAAQALGAAELDGADADFLVASGHKWLGGPAGTGLLWVGPRAEALGGLGWAGDGGHGDAGGASHASEVAQAFEAGGGQDFGRWAGLAIALELHAGLGAHAVARRSHALATGLATRLHAALEGRPHRFADGASWSREPTAQGAHVVLALDGVDPYPLYRRLEAEKIHAKCIKEALATGEVLAHLRFGVPAWESEERLDEVAARFARALG